jgi:hypothetical protein
MTERKARVDAYFVAGGHYHDIDFARAEILKLVTEHLRHSAIGTRPTRHRDLGEQWRTLARATWHECGARPSQARWSRGTALLSKVG